jgi:ABC-type multidrug transport system fused ATPase/permease subunit
MIINNPTLDLDPRNTKKQGTLKRAIRGNSAIVIANRLNTIKDADIIFVFEKGAMLAQ